MWLPAQCAQCIGHRVAALEQGIQTVRLFFQELHSLHLHPQHHPHLALQAGKLICGTMEYFVDVWGENEV